MSHRCSLQPSVWRIECSSWQPGLLDAQVLITKDWAGAQKSALRTDSSVMTMPLVCEPQSGQQGALQPQFTETASRGGVETQGKNPESPQAGATSMESCHTKASLQ